MVIAKLAKGETVITMKEIMEKIPIGRCQLCGFVGKPHPKHGCPRCKGKQKRRNKHGIS